MDRSASRATRWLPTLALLMTAAPALSSCSSRPVNPSAYFQGVDWSTVNYPMTQCNPPGSIGPNPGVPADPVVYAKPGKTPLAIVVVHCHIGSHPPNAVFVYGTGTPRSSPVLLQTLVNEHDYWLATAPPRVNGTGFTLPVAGYHPEDSGANPSIHMNLEWLWGGDDYQELSKEPPHETSGP